VIPLHDNVPMRRFPVVTVILIALNLIAFGFELALPRWGLTLDGARSLFYRAGAVPFELAHGTDVYPQDLVPIWATMLTSLFLHGGWLHVLPNMLFLWIFGNNVEDRMGRLRFAVFYVLCGVTAVMVQTLSDSQSTVPMIGASGAIAGVLGAYLLLYPRARVLTVLMLVVAFPVIWIRAWFFLGAWFALQFAVGLATVGAETGTAYFEHIGGFLAGLVLVWVFAEPQPRLQRRRAAEG